MYTCFLCSLFLYGFSDSRLRGFGGLLFPVCSFLSSFYFYLEQVGGIFVKGKQRKELRHSGIQIDFL
jgi:hypothetical protein